MKYRVIVHYAYSGWQTYEIAEANRTSAILEGIQRFALQYPEKQENIIRIDCDEIPET